MLTKNLRLVLVLLIQFKVTEKKLVFIFVSGKFSEMGTGAQKGMQA